MSGLKHREIEISIAAPSLPYIANTNRDGNVAKDLTVERTTVPAAFSG
tara:strand:- start:230 stop:373 length:144 start_codon:yes stop_codon:yes gene_type:complete